MLEKQEDGSVRVVGYGFWVGKIPYKRPSWLIPLRMKRAVEVLLNTDGLIGFAPIGNKTLVLYETLNDAKRARNKAEYNGIRVYGKDIEVVDTTAEGTQERYV